MTATTAAPHRMKQGNLLPAITAQLQYASTGVPINLNGASVIFIMRLPRSTGSPKVSRAGIITDAVNGLVSYEWQGSDTDTPGLYLAEWQLLFPGSKPYTVPNDGYSSVEITGSL